MRSKLIAQFIAQHPPAHSQIVGMNARRPTANALFSIPVKTRAFNHQPKMAVSRQIIREASVFLSGLLSALLVFLLISEFRRMHHPQRTAPTCIAFGDSITQQGYAPESPWVGLLSNLMVRRMDVVNRGFSGYTTREGLELLPSVLAEHTRIDLVVVFFGANDAVIEGVPQHVSLADYRRNLVDMVGQIRSHANPADVVAAPGPGGKNSRPRVVLVTPPPVSEPLLRQRNADRGKPVLVDRLNSITGLYAAAVRDVGRSLDVPVVDIFSAFLPGGGPGGDASPYLRDGLHLNAAGAEKLFSMLRVVVEPLVGQIRGGAVLGQG